MKHIIFPLMILGLGLPAFAQTEAQSLPISPVTIQTASGEEVILNVEIADDPEELATGMMFRDGVPDGTGMLFDFGEPREANMYMKNVSFGLDMLFLDTDGDVLAIVSHVQPYSLRTINPGFPVKGVLELAEGEAAKRALRPGDRVIHDMFGNVPQEDAD